MQNTWRTAIVCIRGAKENAHKFGTGFICYRDQHYTYLLTCQHVVDDIGQANLTVLGQNPKVLATGDAAIDLALLAVDVKTDCELNKLPVLSLASGAYKGMPISICGHGLRDANDKKHQISIARPLKGLLGADPFLSSPQHLNVPAWDLTILQDNKHEELKDGYSGSPVWDSQRQQVIAIVSHRRGHDMGYAVCLSNLITVYSKAKHWFKPDSPQTSGSATSDYSDDDWVRYTINRLEQYQVLLRFVE